MTLGSRGDDTGDTYGETNSMPTKIAEGTTRYTVVFAHTTIVLFALWCVGHLISTKEVDFSLGGVRGMLMFGLLLALCGSLLAHDFSSGNQEGESIIRGLFPRGNRLYLCSSCSGIRASTGLVAEEVVL